jgi:muconolactone delta-isomerase
MQYLVTMTTTVPEGTTEAEVGAMRRRESVRAGELISEGSLLRLWRPPLQPGEWRTYGLFAAANSEALEEKLASMPLRVWRSDAVLELRDHPNDPAGREGTVAAAPGSEYFTWFTSKIPEDVSPAAVRAGNEGEARRTAELAREGGLLRLWRLAGDGLALGLWQATNLEGVQTMLDSLPLIDWLDVDITPLSVHPSDPAQPLT